MFKNLKIILAAEALAFLVIFYLLSIVNSTNRMEIWQFEGLDIQYEYLHAISLGEGKNIYEKIIHYDLLTNQKYATLFPLYYHFLYGIVAISKFDFGTFMDNYRSVLYVAEIVAALAIYLIFRREGKRGVGFLAAAFFVFNRWTISNILNGKQDVIAIAFLIIALYFLTAKGQKQKVWSFFFYGLSISMKHIGIFLGPIFLMPLITKELDAKSYLKGIGLFLIPTIVVGLPLIMNQPLAFFYSMLFSFTREPSRLNTEFGYNDLLVLYKVGVENNSIFFYLLPRLPLFVFSLGNALLLWFRRVPIGLYCLTSIFIFIAFNPVLFAQYFTWVVPFMFFPALDWSKSK